MASRALRRRGPRFHAADNDTTHDNAQLLAQGTFTLSDVPEQGSCSVGGDGGLPPTAVIS